jgi:hypothetical protein
MNSKMPTTEQNLQAMREMREADVHYQERLMATEQEIRDDVNTNPTPHFNKWKRDFIEHEDCGNVNCERLHNETGHHYGCECSECMREYWMLKH